MDDLIKDGIRYQLAKRNVLLAEPRQHVSDHLPKELVDIASQYIGRPLDPNIIDSIWGQTFKASVGGVLIEMFISEAECSHPCCSPCPSLCFEFDRWDGLWINHLFTTRNLVDLITMESYGMLDRDIADMINSHIGSSMYRLHVPVVTAMLDDISRQLQLADVLSPAT